MDILVIMCLGILVGRFLMIKKLRTANEYLSLLCTFLLIFSMGVMLGQKENFLREITSLGITSFLFFLFPTVFSVLIVYFLTRKFLCKKEEPKEEEK